VALVAGSAQQGKAVWPALVLACQTFALGWTAMVPMAIVTTVPGRVCTTGFTGAHCETPLDIDECAASATACGPNTICTNAPGSYSCACKAGYALLPGKDAKTDGCTDVDECAANTPACGPNGICTNAAGSYSCACETGYEVLAGKDAKTDGCTDIDECTANTPACGPNTICTNALGSYSCACETGYALLTGKDAKTDGCTGELWLGA